MVIWVCFSGMKRNELVAFGRGKLRWMVNGEENETFPLLLLLEEFWEAHRLLRWFFFFLLMSTASYLRDNKTAPLFSLVTLDWIPNKPFHRAWAGSSHGNRLIGLSTYTPFPLILFSFSFLDMSQALIGLFFWCRKVYLKKKQKKKNRFSKWGILFQQMS